MLRSESNSSITTTQPTIGWQPLSLALPLSLFSFLLLHFAFMIRFNTICFIHVYGLTPIQRAGASNLKLEILEKRDTPVVCRKCYPSDEAHANTLPIGSLWSVLHAYMCLYERSSLTASWCLFCMLVNGSFFF